MLVEDLFDLARIDVEAATDDQILLAVDDVVITVVVNLSDVAGGEPAVGGDGGRRRLRQIPVPLHDVVAADLDLTGLARWDFVAVRIDDSHLDTFDRVSDRSRLAVTIGMVERRDRGGFREPVTLENRCTESFLEIIEDLNGKGGAARGADAQRFGGIGSYVLGH